MALGQFHGVSVSVPTRYTELAVGVGRSPLPPMVSITGVSSQPKYSNYHEARRMSGVCFAETRQRSGGGWSELGFRYLSPILTVILHLKEEPPVVLMPLVGLFNVDRVSFQDFLQTQSRVLCLTEPPHILLCQ
jgi:hypothetical protein